MNSYELKLAERKARLEAAAERAAAESNAAHKRSRDLVAGIPMGQPILVGHHSEKRHRKALDKSWDALGKAVEADKRAKELAYKAAGVGTAGISSDDPDAIEKLREKLAGMEADRELMKTVNALIRKKNRAGVVAAMAERYPEKSAENLDALADKLMSPPEHCAWMGAGFPAYALSNLGGNIRRVKERIAALEAATGREAVELDMGAGVVYREDPDENRVMLEFDGKPSDDERKLLKGRGFRWNRTLGAWTRHLNGGGIYAAKSVGTMIVEGRK